MTYNVTKRKHGRGHVYEIDGEKVERVTNIIKSITSKGGGFDRWLQADAVERFQKLIANNPTADWTTQTPYEILKWAKDGRTALDRGTAVHAAAESGNFDRRDYHPDDQGYIDALARFFEEEGPDAHDQELIVGSKELGYAGTLDARGTIGGVSALWDYKTANRVGTTPYIEYHLQLAAYERACREMRYEATERQLVVMLYPNGDYAKFACAAEPHDWAVAMVWYQTLEAARERTAA